MKSTTEYPEQYLEHEGVLYYYLKGHFYKKNPMSGELKNVFDRMLIIDLTGKLSDGPVFVPAAVAEKDRETTALIEQL